MMVYVDRTVSLSEKHLFVIVLIEFRLCYGFLQFDVNGKSGVKITR